MKKIKIKNGIFLEGNDEINNVGKNRDNLVLLKMVSVYREETKKI